MNKNVIKGNWEQVKMKLQQTWEELTDDDLIMIDDDHQHELSGKLDKKHVYKKGKSKKEIRNFLNHYGLAS